MKISCILNFYQKNKEKPKKEIVIQENNQDENYENNIENQQGNENENPNEDNLKE